MSASAQGASHDARVITTSQPKPKRGRSAPKVTSAPGTTKPKLAPSRATQED